MRSTLIRGLAWAALGFFALVALRVGYGYLEQPNGGMRSATSSGDASGFDLEKRNYASTKVERKQQGSDGQLQRQTMDQKYERVADIRARARSFDDDEVALRAAAAQHGGVIQLEHKQGLRGTRVLHLAVGVAPEQFDGFVAAARLIGTAAYLTIDKTDRTNDWRKLEAERQVLEATHASLAALKQRSGSIQELTTLEDRLLDLHQQIQALGISLGDFDQVNELCTVKLTLTEETVTRIASGPTIPLWRRTRVAFEWAVPLYLRLLGAALAAVLIALVGAVVAERLRPWQRLAQADLAPRGPTDDEPVP